MSSQEQTRQLDLTESITEVPQANSIALFIALMEALSGQTHTIATLASLLEVDERTVRYYVDFGRWLDWLRPGADGRMELTTNGVEFVESEPSRGRLFANTFFEQPLVKTVQQLKRQHYADQSEPTATRKACRRAVDGLTSLSEATAERRAQAIAAMLRWAYHPADLDWSTGSPVESPTTPFDFQGQSFLSAFAARQLGKQRTICIGFPRQVVTFACGDADSLSADRWERASYLDDDGSSRWFGSIPTNASTLAAANRGGPDLRRLLIACNPYLAMLVTLLTSRSATSRSNITLTSDMYGMRLWVQNRELGSPLQAMATLATHLDLLPVETVPHLTNGPDNAQLHPADDAELERLLVGTGIVRPVDTSLILAPGVGSELRLEAGDGPTLWERMEPLRDELVPAVRELNPTG